MKVTPTYVVLACFLVILAFLGPEEASWTSAASQRAKVAAGPESGAFVDHPRLFLTSAKRAELIARRDAQDTNVLSDESLRRSGASFICHDDNVVGAFRIRRLRHDVYSGGWICVSDRRPSGAHRYRTFDRDAFTEHLHNRFACECVCDRNKSSHESRDWGGSLVDRHQLTM